MQISIYKNYMTAMYFKKELILKINFEQIID